MEKATRFVQGALGEAEAGRRDIVAMSAAYGVWMRTFEEKVAKATVPMVTLKRGDVGD